LYIYLTEYHHHEGEMADIMYQTEGGKWTVLYNESKYEKDSKLANSKSNQNGDKVLFDETKDQNEDGLREYDHESVTVAVEPFCLAWKDLSVILKKKGTKLIDGVSGIARSGRVLALMGPSG
jgi:hypothetical protein